MTKCPKCGSDDVHAIRVWQGRLGAFIPIGLFSVASVRHHVCASCGFIESYVSDSGARKRIARKWPLAET